VFPCFDQPDLKAVWNFSALVEEDWCVVSNEHEVEDQSRQDRLRTTADQVRTLFEDITVAKPKAFVFRESDRFSTYLFAIVAGPFDFYERNTPGMPPMKIYARKTLIESVNHDEMFTVTQSGMTFYKDFFGVAYPFRKYD
jgi:aminopeptidase N